ncbi:hypothetical protein Nepgr_033172 [Nepenthes gracilis]|uniref:Type 1 phosphatases regulator ypi1 n=1 Tax=Nepenthes gracilis TaxID=150966 RepID=A0AAD3TLE6_NEPGR|nr:hypothetical protein Nepgr_033172 [Nepenthes gracilis]
MSSTRTMAPSATIAQTLTLENPCQSSNQRRRRRHQQPPPKTLVLRLNIRKKVCWKEGTVDNEFLGKKSSKKCCIFHKQKPFEEDDSDEDDHLNCDHHNDYASVHAHGHGESACCSD